MNVKILNNKIKVKNNLSFFMIQVEGTILEGSMAISLLHLLDFFLLYPLIWGKIDDKPTYT